MHTNTGAKLYNYYKMYKYIRLKTTLLRTSRFYIQPKIHKQGHPRRPAISSVNCYTSIFFKVCRLSASANSSTNTIDNSYLVSLYASPLYTSISNYEKEQ